MKRIRHFFTGGLAASPSAPLGDWHAGALLYERSLPALSRRRHHRHADRTDLPASADPRRKLVA